MTETAFRTCQCCGRKIGATKGRIAHHGYTRPAGWYYQTRSCEGARMLPFEVSKTALEKMIAAHKTEAERLVAYIASVKAGTAPVVMTWTERKGGWSGPKVPQTITVTPETWEAMKVEHFKVFRQHGWHAFETQKAVYVLSLERNVVMIQYEVEAQEKRAAAWVQTEKWNPETKSWEAI